MNSLAAKLSDRLIEFSVIAINICRQMKSSMIEKEIARQLLRSATSIGANYEEGCGAQSKADFIHKLRIAFKEAKESIYWLKVVQRAALAKEDSLEKSIHEANEIASILGKSLRTAAGKQKIEANGE